VCWVSRVRYNQWMKLNSLVVYTEWMSMSFKPWARLLGSLFRAARPSTKSSSPSKEKQGEPVGVGHVALLLREPWRMEQREGKQGLCPGDHNSLRFDDSAYWLCETCGRVSRLQYIRHTVPPARQSEATV
jgi:hypothetical protein